MSDAIVICPNEGGDGNYTWLSSGPGAQIKTALKKGQAEFEVLNGEFPFRGESDWLYLGSKSVLHGPAEVKMPADRSIRVLPDPLKMPVFKSGKTIPETTEAHTPDIGVLRVSGAEDVVVRDIGMAGHVGIELIESSGVTVKNVAVTNLTPAGQYCNMGYSRTGALWINRSCHNILLDSCSVVGSHHHGILLHTGSLSKSMLITDVMIDACRVFDSGSGMLRGDNASDIADSIRHNPGREGHGFRAWACGVDLQENAHIARVTARRLWVENTWKSGIYQEPAYEGNETTCRDLLVVDCDSVGNGFRGGGAFGELMNVKEGENSNYFIHAGTVKNCRSNRARKAAFYAMYERYESPKERLVVDGFIDYDSPYGIVLEQGASDNVVFRNVELHDNTVQPVQLMGSRINLDGIAIYCAGLKVPPIVLGKMGKLINDESRDPDNVTSVKRYLAGTWTMPSFKASGIVYGLAEGIPLWRAHPGSVVPSPVIALVRGVLPVVQAEVPGDVPVVVDGTVIPYPAAPVGQIVRRDGCIWLLPPNGAKPIQGHKFPDQFANSIDVQIWIEDGSAIWASAHGVDPVVVDWVPQDLQFLFPSRAFPIPK